MSTNHFVWSGGYPDTLEVTGLMHMIRKCTVSIDAGTSSKLRSVIIIISFTHELVFSCMTSRRYGSMAPCPPPRLLTTAAPNRGIAKPISLSA